MFGSKGLLTNVTSKLQIPYSGLLLKQKFSQERQKLNFEELNFRRLQILKNFN